MNDALRINDLVVLREAMDQHGLLPGRIGRVLNVLSPDAFETEFVDDNGRTIAIIQLSQGQVAVLRHEATLDETDFWRLIETAKEESAGDPDQQVRLLIEGLAERSIADIFAFRDVFDKFRDLAYKRELWAAAYIIGNGCGDDGFSDFRAWLMAQGRQVFFDTLRDPEIITDLVPVIENEIFGRRGEVELEPMNSVAYYAYEKKTGEEMPVFFGSHTPVDLSGEEWDESTVTQKYPRLAAKFWTWE